MFAQKFVLTESAHCWADSIYKSQCLLFVCLFVGLSVPSQSPFFKRLITPSLKVQKLKKIFTKRFLKEKLRKDIVIRIGNFGSKMVKNCCGSSSVEYDRHIFVLRDITTTQFIGYNRHILVRYTHHILVGYNRLIPWSNFEKCCTLDIYDLTYDFFGVSFCIGAIIGKVVPFTISDIAQISI